MFTGEFTARAGTAEGQFAQIDLRSIRIFPTPLAFTPHGIIVLTG
jgi:hypothetical protein